MNLKTINEIIGRYCKTLIDGELSNFEALCDDIDKFQTNWDSSVSDYKTMFTQSFNMDFWLWKDKDFYPLRSILRYIDINDEVVRSIFKDLFDERREIVGRIDRFLYQCDDFVLIDRRTDQKAPAHYHQDKSVIFGYLCFMYPDEYALYNANAFLRFMTKVGAKDLDQLPDINRFIKVTKIVKTLLLKNPSYLKLITNEEKSDKLENLTMIHVSAILNDWI